MTDNNMDKKNVLFVCIGNMCRSQMAEGFARSMGSDIVEAYSAGISHTGVISERAIAVMEEKGIDISRQRSKGLDELPLLEMDYIINMATSSADDVCPPSYAGEKLVWRVLDPIGESTECFESVRDDIEKRVKGLLQTIWKGNPTP
jgi:arsenate reductase